jgi:uncharacterized membrane protein YccC
LDREGLAFATAARCTLGLLVPLLAGVALGAIGDGVSAAVGALVVGFVSYEGRHRAAERATLLAALGVTLSVLVGALVGGHPALLLLVLAVWGLAGGVLGTLGPGPSIASLQAVVALVVFSAIPLGTRAAFVQAAWVLAGSVLQVVLLRLHRPRHWVGAERRGLAEAYERLARWAAEPTPGPPPPDQLDVATEALRSPDPRLPPSAVEDLATLLLLAERLRVALAGTSWSARAETGPIGTGPAGTGRLVVARRLVGIAHQLTGSPPPDPGERTDPADPTVADLLRQADERVAHLRHETSVPARWRRRPAGPRWRPSLRGALGALADPAGARHAVRLAVVLVAGSLLAHGLGLANGYWVPMTAAVVVRGDFTGTLRRGLGRALGTLVGAGLVTLATTLTHPGTPLLVAGTVLAGLGTYTLFRANYGLYSVFLTSTVVLLLALVGASPGRTAEERVLATTVGAALALVVFLLWPTWREDLLPGTLAAAAQAQRAYATTLLALADTPQVAAATLARLDSLGRRARTTRARLLALTGALPAATPDSPSRCLGAITELAHTSLALHAQLLTRARLGPSDGSPDPAGPHLARLDSARLDPAEATRRALARLDQAGCPDQPTLV